MFLYQKREKGKEKKICMIVLKINIRGSNKEIEIIKCELI